MFPSWPPLSSLSCDFSPVAGSRIKLTSLSSGHDLVFIRQKDVGAPQWIKWAYRLSWFSGFLFAEECPTLPRTAFVDVTAKAYPLGTKLFYKCDDGYMRRSGQYLGIRCQSIHQVASWVYKDFECIGKWLLSFFYTCRGVQWVRQYKTDLGIALTNDLLCLSLQIRTCNNSILPLKFWVRWLCFAICSAVIQQI